MGATVEAVHRLATEVFQLKRRQAVVAFARQDPLRLRHLRRGDKRYRLLDGQHHPQRTVIGCQPERDLGALRGIPPVSGQ